ncbi:MAG: D-2-hydroxyacid dehydrogenase [Aggregatilineales bacterium]
MQDQLNVLILVNFSDAILERLKAISPRLRITRRQAKAAGDIPPDVWRTVDIMYTGQIAPEPETVPRLRWIQSHYAGVDWLMAQPLLNSEDIIVTTTSGIHAPNMAEYTLAMMLAFARRLPVMWRLQANADWPDNKYELLLPRELRGATLGIVGYGSIGRATARLAQAFGMQVLATKRDAIHPSAPNEYQVPGTGDADGVYVNRLYPPEALKLMLAECDFVQVAVPSTRANFHLIDEGALSAMRKTAVLINVARGDVVDEAAMIRALQTKQIGGAALDVFEKEPLPADSPLWKLDNVIISPHIAGNTDHYNESAAEVFAQNLERYLTDQELLNRVDRARGY